MALTIGGDFDAGLEAAALLAIESLRSRVTDPGRAALAGALDSLMRAPDRSHALPEGEQLRAFASSLVYG